MHFDAEIGGHENPPVVAGQRDGSPRPSIAGSATRLACGAGRARGRGPIPGQGRRRVIARHPRNYSPPAGGAGQTPAPRRLGGAVQPSGVRAGSGHEDPGRANGAHPAPAPLVAIPGLGVRGARKIEAFFAAHPQLTERARALIDVEAAPWEWLAVPDELDGSHGTFRAPRSTCRLSADNDYEAVQAWLALHESPATQSAYRKEAERLILWLIVERGPALSSLTTEGAGAYRSFLRRPAPRSRWVGSPRPRSSPERRPFAGGLSPRSAAYAQSVLGGAVPLADAAAIHADEPVRGSQGAWRN